MDPLDKATGRFPFEYTKAVSTDVRLTWQKARDEMKKNAEELKAKVRKLGSANQ